MDQGTEFGSDFQHLCQYKGILPVVTDMETPWQNSVVERACSLEAPTTEAEVDDLIDSRFAELNRQVGRAGFSLVQPVFGRKFDNRRGCSRTTSSTPNRTPKDAADSKVTTTAVRNQRRKAKWALVAGESVLIHRRKDGAQRTVWPWIVRVACRTEAWTERDSVGTHAELPAQVPSHPGEARDQRRSGRNRDRCIDVTGTD